MKLKNVEVNPGRLCNNKCVFCMSGEERDDHEPWANPERMREELRRHYEDGARSVGFLGGEPSAYPHIVECIAYARSLGYLRIALCTNGTTLDNRDFVLSLVEAGLTRTTVSIHSHKPDIEDALTGIPGNFERKLKALENLVEMERAGRLPYGLSLNPVLCRPTAPLLEDFVRFFAARGLRDFRFNFIWPQSRVLTDKKVIPQFKDAVPYMLDLIRKNEKELGLTISFGAVPFCVLPKTVRDRWPLLEKYFYEEGIDLPTNVSFLQPDREGTVNRFNLKARTRYDHRTKVAACGGCRFEDKCLGVWGTYVDLYGDGEFGLKEAAAA